MIIIQRPSAGLAYANKPNLKTQAIILISITFFIPNRYKKNGMASIKSVSEIWEIDIIMVEYFTANESA